MIVVGGEALIDRIHNDDGTQHAAPGGGPFNTARGLGRLAVPTAFLGRLSTDAFGREMASLLAKEGGTLSMASIRPQPTTIAIADVRDERFADYQSLVQGT